MTNKEAIIESSAFVAAIAAAAGTTVGAMALARGETPGAPGVTKALARLGHSVGGSMLTGVALLGGCAALVAIGVYQGLRQLDI